MNILSINTAFNQTYVAVKSKTGTFLNCMDSSLKQSENLLGLIDETLKQANINAQQLDKIACVIGPGSFTGIRIGVGVCKGLCFGKNVLRCGINSLDLLAYTFAQTQSSTDFWVVLNALSGNLFARKFDKNGNPVSECELISGEEVDIVTGVVVGLEEEQLEVCNNYVSFSAKDLLNYSETLQSGLNFVPLYLRKSQAETELDKKNANN